MNMTTQARITFACMLIAAFAITYAGYLKFKKPTTPVQTIQSVSPAGVSTSIEVKPLDQVGSMAADSLRTRINEINAGYLQLQETERKALDLNAEWNLDLPGNRMIHQAPPQPASSPAPAKK